MNKDEYKLTLGPDVPSQAGNMKPCNQAARDFYEANKERLPGLRPPQDCPDLPAALLDGPGTELKKLLRLFGIKPAQCGCEEWVRKMNQWGVEGCTQNTPQILDHLAKQAKKRKLPFNRFAAERLVRHAIWRAKRKKSG